MLKSKVFSKVSKFLKLTVEKYEENIYESSKSISMDEDIEVRIKELLKVATAFVDLMLKNRA